MLTTKIGRWKECAWVWRFYSSTAFQFSLKKKKIRKKLSVNETEMTMQIFSEKGCVFFYSLHFSIQ